MYRTLNRLRWSLFVFGGGWDFLWPLVFLTAMNVITGLIIFNTFHYNLKELTQGPRLSYLSILIWYPLINWFQLNTLARSARQDPLRWIMPESTAFYIASMLGVAVGLSGICSIIWALVSIPVMNIFLVFACIHMLLLTISEMLILPSTPNWIRNNPQLTQWIIFISFLSISTVDRIHSFYGRIIADQGWTISCVLLLTYIVMAITFIFIASLRREHIPVTIIDNRGWNSKVYSKRGNNSEPVWWRNWTNGLFDRRLEQHLSRVRANGISSMITQWSMGNRILWSAGFFYALWPALFFILPQLLFSSLQSIDFSLSTVMGYLVFGCAWAFLLVPITIAFEWSRRRKVMELEVLRPVRTAEFQLQIAVAFLRDLLPSIPITCIGLLGMWYLTESSSERLQFAYFFLMFSPSILVFMIAVAAAYALLDNIGARFMIVMFTLVSGFIAYMCYLSLLWMPALAFFVSTIYFVMSLVWIRRLYQTWEDMELGRHDSIEFD